MRVENWIEKKYKNGLEACEIVRTAPNKWLTHECFGLRPQKIRLFPAKRESQKKQ